MVEGERASAATPGTPASTLPGHSVLGAPQAVGDEPPPVVSGPKYSMERRRVVGDLYVREERAVGTRAQFFHRPTA
jgi:hypothetical protein